MSRHRTSIDITPASGSVTGGTSVTITGTDFTAGATVTIGGIAATSVTVVDSATITATTGAHAAGAVDVVVTNPDAQNDTLTGGYTYVGSLTITAQPANFSYSATLSGDPLTRTSSFAVGVNDSTGSGAGMECAGRDRRAHEGDRYDPGGESHDHRA